MAPKNMDMVNPVQYSIISSPPVSPIIGFINMNFNIIENQVNKLLDLKKGHYNPILVTLKKFYEFLIYTYFALIFNI